MTIYQWVLLAFAAWTLAVLVFGVGVARLRSIARGAKLADFPADVPHGSPRYRRIMRAHANCVENLPVYGAIVVLASLAGVATRELDALALVLIVARIGQSIVHIAFVEASATVAARFSLFLVQLAAMIAMAVEVVAHAA